MVLNLAKCSECGQGVPTDARLLGLCPRCLMRNALVRGSGSSAGRGGLGATEPPLPYELGTSLAGLEVIELIGRGGMGFVYKARQRSLDRLVAVKLFPRDAYEDPSFAERFANEARILANLSHPNIVAAYEFGESREYCHLVMELVEGQSLRQQIQRGPMLQEEALRIALQVCDALDYAHGRGVIHRDIKPENILLEAGRDGGARVRVADFGLARLIQRRPTDFSMTAPNRLMGTPDYMAPEQRQRPAEVDARADVYALGVVLYEMLTGRLPLGRFAVPTGVAKLNRVVLKCLEAEPANRYAGVGEIRRELERAQAWRSRRVWIAGGAAALALACAGTIWMTHRPAAPSHSPLVDRKPEPRRMASTGPATLTLQAHQEEVVYSPPPSPPAIDPRPTEIWTAVPEWEKGIYHPPDHFPRPGFPSAAGMYGRDDFYDRMVREHGASRIVRVFIDDVKEEQKQPILKRLKELSGATTTMMSGANGMLSIQLAPVRDVDGLAKKIDFGKVTSINPQKREIEVRATSTAP